MGYNRFSRRAYRKNSGLKKTINFWWRLLENETVYTNPLLIIEVLSTTTEDYDRGSKFTYYRSLASLKEYVIVSPQIYKIESWFKQEENAWRISNVEGLEKNLSLYSLNIEISLRGVYDQVKI